VVVCVIGKKIYFEKSIKSVIGDTERTRGSSCWQEYFISFEKISATTFLFCKLIV